MDSEHTSEDDGPDFIFIRSPESTQNSALDVPDTLRHEHVELHQALTTGNKPGVTWQKGDIVNPENDIGPGSEKPEVGVEPEVASLLTRSDTEVTECCLMTDDEIEEQDRRLQCGVQQLQHHLETFQSWEKDLNARRLKVFGKMKTLSRGYRSRMEVYESVSDYIQETKAVTSSRKNP